MRTILALLAVSVALAVTGASALAGTGDSASARVYASDSAPLTAPSKAAPATIVGKFLRERGVSAPTVATMNLVSSVRSARTRLTYVRFEQQVAGVRVADAYAKAALTDRGELVN